ncbi:MAG: SDR family oxidoreductase [Planctomycetes bacterium]|nr:SDR family oxidoreductase [Planctomycetota bacterium]
MTSHDETLRDSWALVLGSSSGFGAATSIELARRGMHVFGVHLDRKATLPNAERVVAEIRSAGREALFFNVNAAGEGERTEVCNKIAEKLAGAGDPGFVRVVLHSLAFGTLKPYFADKPEEMVTQRQIEMTLDVMANSLVYWCQDLYKRKLLRSGSRIFSMTSAGSQRIWKSYGPVSAAKCALESHTRQIACELAPEGITANCIMAGVTDTPSLRKIPGSEVMVEHAIHANPGKRLTTPEDVARAIAVLARPESAWLTGAVIPVDGGEILA